MPLATLIEMAACIVEELIMLTLVGHMRDALNVIPLTHNIGY